MLAMGATIETLKGHTDSLPCVTFHPTNPDIVATGSMDMTAKIWNRKTGECTMTLKGHTDQVLSVAFHPTNPTP